MTFEYQTKTYIGRGRPKTKRNKNRTKTQKDKRLLLLVGCKAFWALEWLAQNEEYNLKWLT